MEVSDDSDLSEEWIILSGEQDISDGCGIITDTDQDVKNKERHQDCSDITTEDNFGDSEGPVTMSDLHLPDENRMSADQECLSEKSSTSCVCDELPKNIEFTPAVRAYVHKRNVKLNRALSLCLVFTLTMGLSLGFGNFWGWLSCSNSEKYPPPEQHQLEFLQGSSSPITSRTFCLQFFEQTDDFEALDKDIEVQTSDVGGKKIKAFPPLDIISGHSYSNLEKYCTYISKFKGRNEKDSSIRYSLQQDAQNSKQVIGSYLNISGINLTKGMPQIKKLDKSTPDTAYPVHFPSQIHNRKVFDTKKISRLSSLFIPCIKPPFYNFMLYQCSQYEVTSFQNVKKEESPKQVITSDIPITPMLLDKDESSKTLKRQYMDKRRMDLNTRLREIERIENEKQRYKAEMESVSKTKTTPEKLQFTDEGDIQKWFHEHIEHIVMSTYDLISLQLRKNKESPITISENGLNTTEKVFHELLKCLVEKLHDVQLFRSSPLFTAHLYHSRKALRNFAKAIMAPVNKLLKNSATFLVQDKPLNRRLNKLLKNILGSIQRLEYRWVEIKDKWFHMINKEQQKLLTENQQGYNGINHFNEKYYKWQNEEKIEELSQKEKYKNMDTKFKNKDTLKNQFIEKKRNKHDNRQFENKGKHSKSRGYSKYNCYECHNGKKDSKRKANQYFERNANFKTNYKEINQKQQIRIPSYGKPDYYFVSTQ